MTHNPFVFFRQFLADPIAVGAVLPTSLATARMMALPADPQGTVLELGAGTGSITEGIVERLGDASRLTSVEIDPALADEFRANFPNVRLIVGDAEQVLHDGPGWNTIISGVPFTMMEPGKRARLFDLVKQKLAPNGVFVAIQYSLSSKAQLQHHFQDVTVRFSPLNLPPAVIYVCRDPIQ